jgi:metal-sulfur cluster biosynthetic enzyme
MGLIAGVEISGDRVEVKVRLTSPVCLQASNIAEAVCDAVRGLTWVTDARCSFDAGNEWEPEMMNPAVRHELRQRRRLNSKGQAPLATGLVNRRTQKVEK